MFEMFRPALIPNCALFSSDVCPRRMEIENINASINVPDNL